MKKNKLYSLEIAVMIIVIMESCILGMATDNYIRLAGVDCWLSIIIGSILGFIPLIIYLVIMNYKPNLNLNQLNEYLFGKIIGKIINIILLLGVVFFIMTLSWNFTNYTSTQFLYDTPKWYLSLLIAIPIIYLISKDIHTIARTTFLIYIIMMILYIASIASLAPQYEIQNVLPFMEHGINPVMNGALSHVACIILPIFLITIIPKNDIKDSSTLNKKVIIAYLVGNLITFSILFSVMSIFGIELSTLYQYPDFQILKRAFTGGFIERVEGILAIQLIIDVFMCLAIGYYYIKVSLENITPIKNSKWIVYICILIFPFISDLFFNNYVFFNDFTLKYYPSIISTFLFVLPLIIVITIFIKKRKEKIHHLKY